MLGAIELLFTAPAAAAASAFYCQFTCLFANVLFNGSEIFDAISATWHSVLRWRCGDSGRAREREGMCSMHAKVQYKRKTKNLTLCNCGRNWICIFKCNRKSLPNTRKINDIICGFQVANFQSKLTRISLLPHTSPSLSLRPLSYSTPTFFQRQFLFRYFTFSTACVCSITISQHKNHLSLLKYISLHLLFFIRVEYIYYTLHIHNAYHKSSLFRFASLCYARAWCAGKISIYLFSRCVCKCVLTYYIPYTYTLYSVYYTLKGVASDWQTFKLYTCTLYSEYIHFVIC